MWPDRLGGCAARREAELGPGSRRGWRHPSGCEVPEGPRRRGLGATRSCAARERVAAQEGCRVRAEGYRRSARGLPRAGGRCAVTQRSPGLGQVATWPGPLSSGLLRAWGRRVPTPGGLPDPRPMLDIGCGREARGGYKEKHTYRTTPVIREFSLCPGCGWSTPRTALGWRGSARVGGGRLGVPAPCVCRPATEPRPRPAPSPGHPRPRCARRDGAQRGARSGAP